MSLKLAVVSSEQKPTQSRKRTAQTYDNDANGQCMLTEHYCPQLTPASQQFAAANIQPHHKCDLLSAL